MQRDVEDQGTDHPALRSSFFGWGETTFVEHASFQPAPDQFPGRERPELVEDVVMSDSVERRCQVRIEHPKALGVFADHRPEDGGDGILA